MSQGQVHQHVPGVNRRGFLGGSDARIIMGADEAALVRLWREKRGEVEPEDLSGNLIVQLGVATEPLNRSWYERNTGHAVKEVQRWVRHPVIRCLAATVDGVVEGTGAVFEAKFMLPWSFSEEAAAEKHMAQLQHNMWVTNATLAVLSVIIGGGKWVEISISADRLYQHLLLTAEKKFWRCVESGEPPCLFGVESPRARIEAVRIVDMSSSNAWAEFSSVFRRTREIYLEHENAKGELKKLMPEDARESIGTIAAALAKAQAELTNPEKSLVGTIRSSFPREGERTFRYAPLSSGLDIVRKSLGRHEIATIQATAIDKDAGLLRLTTVLAHSSGEWISSEWPVCQITDIASAQRMGAALTYARRYVLFTLVGIAGEDDLDAPDLGTVSKAEVEQPRAGYHTQSDGHGGLATRPPRDGSNSAASARPVLAPEESATLRERLVAELSAINSADDAAIWAHRNLPAKNSLTAVDAQIVETQFKARLSTVSDDVSAEEPNKATGNQRRPAVDQPAADARQKTSTVAEQRSRGGAARA